MRSVAPKLVLVVDDDEVERYLLRRALEDRGYLVEEAETADDALICCQFAQPDALVSDIFLPGSTGIELCRALRSEAGMAHLPVILLTGSKDPGIRDQAKVAGASVYLQKTPDLSPVINAVSGLLSLGGNPAPVNRH
ncbi:MAG: response regulator [Rhodocyclaceae bacterium]|nr:response regulator [Rhodocyclaceae bacterium]